MLYLAKFQLRYLFMVLLCCLSSVQAQQLMHSISDKSVIEYMKQAGGLKIADSGQVLMSSTREAVLLVQNEKQFKTIKLQPSIFKDPGLAGIDQMQDGRLVLVNEGSGRIAIIDEHSNQLTRLFSRSGGGAGEINDPRGVAVSINKRIYVADRGNDRISVFNDQGLFLQAIGNHDRDDRDLSNPTHVALDANENIYVLEAGERNRVSIFRSSGELIKQLDSKTFGQILGSPVDFSAMTVDLNGTLYLADEHSWQIVAYNWRNKRILNRFGVLGESIGQYRDLSQMSVNNQGQLAVLDKVNGKVEVYQLEQKTFSQPVKTNTIKLGSDIHSDCRSVHTFIDGQTLCIRKNGHGIVKLSSEGKELGQFASEIKQPSALHSGKQMVAILQKNKLYAYTHDGQKIYSLGRLGSLPGSFDNPTHVFTAHNNIYVADSGNNRVQIFAKDGQFVKQIEGGSSETFEQVGAIAVDSRKNLYIADGKGDRMIKVLDEDLIAVASIGHKKPSSHKAKKIHALDFDQQDRLYALVTSSINKYSIRLYDGYHQILEFGSGGENGSDVYFEKVGSMFVSSTDKNSIFINDYKRKKLFRFDYHEYPGAAFDLRVSANASQVKLEWNSSRSPLITHYEIHAAATEQGPFIKISTTTDLTKTLTVQETQHVNWFHIRAIGGYDLPAQPSMARENQYNKLLQWYKAERFADVVALADRLLRMEQDNADLLQLKADSESRSGRHQAALASYRQLEHYADHKNHAIRQQVRVYFELEQYLDVKSLIDPVLAQQPKQVYPYLICAELSLKLSDAIGAVTCAEDGLTLNPGHVRLRYLLGKAYILAGIEGKGLDEYRSVVDAHPGEHGIRLLIADDLMRMQRYKQALGHYNALAKASPSMSEAIIGKTNALLKLDRDDEAKALAIKLSTNKQTRGDGYYLLGKIAVKQKKHAEALLHLTRASKSTPDNIVAWISLAQAYIELKKISEAVTSLSQGIKANPGDYRLYLLAGKLELEQEHYLQANSYLDKAVSLNRQSIEAIKLYAHSLFATRNYYRAASYAHRAAKAAPKDTEILALQADIARQQGKIVSAIEYLKTAISLQPSSAQLQYRLGRVYLHANLFDKSQQHLEKATAINSAWAEPHIALGQLLQKRQLFDLAIASFEQAVQLDPTNNNKAMLNAAFSDKKRSLEFNSNAPKLLLSDLNLKHVFSAAYKQYADQSIGSVTLKNASNTDYGNLQLSFHIKEYMDFPMTQDITLIKANESRQYEFKVTFNNKILQVDEDIGVQVEVKLTYNRNGQKDSIRLSQPMTIYGKNAMVWGDAEMVGSFVTPKDDTLRDYVRTVINEFQPDPGPLNDKLVAAMTYFSSLTAAGTKYIVDPNTPYTTLRDDQVDYVQFPRETLKLKSGDCDDLSVLLSAGLENLGIETVFLETPGHLLMMFNTGLAEQQTGLISSDSSLLVIRNDQVWIPLEATMLGASFNEAWAEGASKYYKARAENKLGIIDLRQAWQQYKPVTLGKSSYDIGIPDSDRTRSLIKLAKDQLLSKSIDRLILPYQSMILNDPTNIKARMQIAILYTRYGLYDNAQMAFDALREIAPENSGVHTNQGNLYLLTAKYDEAIASYRQAVTLDELDGGIWVNISMAHYRKGELKAAGDAYQQAVTLSPEIKNHYSVYSKLLSQ